jgi:glycosidase
MATQPLAQPRFGADPGTVDTPTWVHHAVFYQIFPDRFARSARVPKPSGVEPWETDPTTYGYKGGDLVGVLERLDYLADLGVNAIYLNPIFQSASNHRYHTHDYFRVDPLLGGDEAFDALLDAAHARGMRVILDGVFNHASRGFFYFNDVLENGDASPWRDWFHIENEHPINAYDHGRPPGYRAWWGMHALPKLNTDNPQMREYLMQVGEHWIRKGVDGWRLDVPDEITTPGFWEEFRERVRRVNPEAYIVGEIWHIDREALNGRRFDALMNYAFTEAALAFAGRDRIVRELQESRGYNPWPGIDGATYAEKIETLLASYDWNVQLAQMNLLDSHDTARALSLAGGDQRTLELAALLMFTFPGAPTIYYGTEIGLDGGLPDKWARKPFPWHDESRWNHELRALYRSLTALRHGHEALRTGTYTPLASSYHGYAFRRELDGVTVTVAVNSGNIQDEVCLDTPPAGREPVLVVGEAPSFNGLMLTLPGRSAAIWIDAPRD